MNNLFSLSNDKMNKEIAIILAITLIVLGFGGCVQNKKMNVIYVDDDFNSKVTGWQIDHFKTIQKAINAIEKDGTIFVDDGIYKENIIINKPLFLIGNNTNKTIIEGIKDGADTITIESADNITIIGFSIKTIDGNMGKKSTISNIMIYTNNNNISGNIFENSSIGINTENSYYNVISNNKFAGNYFGIQLFTNSCNNTIMNNVFLSNQIGCKIKSSKYNYIAENIFAENVGGAYLCCGSIDNKFHLNIFYNNEEWNAQDWALNIWNGSKSGNYWGDFHLPSQGAFDVDNNGIVDTIYNISRGFKPSEYPNKDYYPLVTKPMITNPFFTIKET